MFATIFGSKEANHIWFTEVTLISQHGLGISTLNNDKGRILEELFGWEPMYNSAYIRKLSLKTWINVVYGTMTEINRFSNIF